MIVLDTNVVSEMMRPRPDAGVYAWLDAQAPETLYLASLSLAELLFGVAVLPMGKRRDKLSTMVEGVESLFRGRVLEFDAAAARRFATLAAAARAAGLGFPRPDGYIAAIAAEHRYSVATRDIGPFDAAGLDVINPWRMPSGGRSAR